VLSQGEPHDTAVNFDGIEFYNKSITERLFTLNTAALSTRRIWRQSWYKTPWITFRGHSRSRILGSLKSRRWTAYYRYLADIADTICHVYHFSISREFWSVWSILHYSDFKSQTYWPTWLQDKRPTGQKANGQKANGTKGQRTEGQSDKRPMDKRPIPWINTKFSHVITCRLASSVQIIQDPLPLILSTPLLHFL